MKVGTDAMILGSVLNVADKSYALDIGSGTGVLSLMAAQQNNSLKITGVEIDEVAALESLQNISNSPYCDRIKIVHTDFLKWKPSKKFDFIFSNPPYHLNSLNNRNERTSIARHIGNDFLDYFATQCANLLESNGELQLIVPYNDRDLWISCFKEHGIYSHEILNVYGKIDGNIVRSVLTFSRIKGETLQHELTIRDEVGNYTKAYISLTKDFHFNDLSKDQ